jgi:hypothetical protein
MDVKTALMELAEAVKRILNDRIRTYGINPKVGQNTLEGSELQKSIQVTVTEDGIALQIADYWEFVARGWKRTGNYPGTMRLFVRNIDEWVRRKGIRVGNLKQSQIVWAIIKNIWDKGLRERPFMIYEEDGDLTKMIPELDKYMDTWFEHLYDAITADLDNYFNAA